MGQASIASMSRWNAEREEQRIQATHEELVKRVERALPDDGIVEPLPGLMLHRVSVPTPLGHGTSYPSFCVIAQGSKEILLGEKRYLYNPAQYLISAASLPIATRITEASSERPYLGLVLRLDPTLVGSVLVEAGRLPPRYPGSMTAIDVSPLDAGLLDAMVRLVRLLDSPTEARFLASLTTREIVLRLMLGTQGGRLHHIAMLGDSTHRIAQAIERIRKDFDQPLRIEDIARDLGMSVSGFHHHFRTLTAMSPLQFQKQLRLQEARRLMLGEGVDAASAGFRVGYGTASHFTREYKRLFGAPPMHDIERLREGQSMGLLHQNG